VAAATADGRVGTASGWLGGRAGLDAGIVGVWIEAEKRRCWAGVAGAAEMWKEEAEACGVAGEDGLRESGVGSPEVAVVSCGGCGGSQACWSGGGSAA